jgi:hypothetical protein
MTFPLRLALAALSSFLLVSQARAQTGGAVGLEIPAPQPPSQGHFLTGAYVSGTYTPRLMAGRPSYAVQPYLRYVLGSSGQARPFVQYNFAPYWLQTNGGPGAGPDFPAQSGNGSFAPLSTMHSPVLNGYGLGGWGSFSVGVPVRVGRGPAMLHIAGSVLGGLVR